jgi:hypothetical protein
MEPMNCVSVMVWKGQVGLQIPHYYLSMDKSFQIESLIWKSHRANELRLHDGLEEAERLIPHYTLVTTHFSPLTWWAHGANELRLRDGAEGAGWLALVPASVVKPLAQQLNGRLGKVLLTLQPTIS